MFLSLSNKSEDCLSAINTLNNGPSTEVEFPLLANLLALESSSQVFRVLVRVSVLSCSSTYS